MAQCSRMGGAWVVAGACICARPVACRLTRVVNQQPEGRRHAAALVAARCSQVQAHQRAEPRHERQAVRVKVEGRVGQQQRG